MGLEGHLWSLGTGVDEGVDLGWGEAFGRPVPGTSGRTSALGIADLFDEIAEVAARSVPVDCNDAMSALCLNPDIGFSYAANPERARAARIPWPGVTPEAPKGIWPANRRGKGGRSRPWNGFWRVQFLSVFHRLFLGLQVLSLPLVRTGCGTGCGTILGESRSAIHAGFASKNVVVTGQRWVRNLHFGGSDALPECLQGLFLRLSCGPFPSRPSPENSSQ